MNKDLLINLNKIFVKYQDSFKGKNFNSENNDFDILMDIFNITPEMKTGNKQYWGRELGMCWQLIITEIAKKNCKDFKPALRIGGDEPTDLFIGNDAIDTKYRIGSGDSGTLKKFKKYGKFLKDEGYRPVLLILRDDNLKAAITACTTGGWDIFIGEDCFSYIKNKTGCDLKSFLIEISNKYNIDK